MELRDKYLDPSSPIYTEIDDGLIASDERSISGQNNLSGRKETAFYAHARQVISSPSGVVFVLGENSKEVFCNKCKSQVWTRLQFKSGLLTWLCFGSCFLYGLVLCCCCLVPFCTNRYKDVHHHCPNCMAFIGTYQRI